jgi:NADH-ubiquinone oxidoreductase chain 4
LAHVEAPVFGSMILAGILLKLGGIGITRFINIIQGSYFKVLCISIRLVGTVIVGATCLKITDLKSVIAFSSVSHIGIVIFILIISSKISI